METITKISFKELSDTHKCEIVGDLTGDYWYHCLLEDIEDELDKEGFEDPEISFSGFHSQGDGASFTTENIVLSQFFDQHLDNFDFTFSGKQDEEVRNILEKDLNLEPQVFFIQKMVRRGLFIGRVIRIDNRYLHYNTVSIDFEEECYSVVPPEEADIDFFDFTHEQNKEVKKFSIYFEKYIENWVKLKCKEIYDRLYKEYEQHQKELMKQLEEENKTWTP